MPTYNATLFDPPAPLAYVTVRHPQIRDSHSEIPMLLDTGADITLLPEFVIDTLEISPVVGRTYELMGFDGTISTAPVVQLELVFCERVFGGGILGRNVLNALHLVFNSPNQSWAEYTSR